MSEKLKTAIIAAGTELAKDHCYTFDDELNNEPPRADGVFVEVMMKHLMPLVDPNWKETRIAQLRAEIETLLREDHE